MDNDELNTSPSDNNQPATNLASENIVDIDNPTPPTSAVDVVPEEPAKTEVEDLSTMISEASKAVDKLNESLGNPEEQIPGEEVDFIA